MLHDFATMASQQMLLSSVACHAARSAMLPPHLSAGLSAQLLVGRALFAESDLRLLALERGKPA